MIELPYIAIPRQSESFSSVMLRLAYRNGFDSIEHFFRNYKLGGGGIAVNQWAGSNLYNFLMRQKSLSETARQALRSTFHPRRMYHRKDVFSINGVYLPTQTIRQSLAICPSCVREGCLEQMHSYVFCDTCPIHSEYYHESCQNCGLKFEWRHINDYKCPCGFRLRDLESQPTESYATQLVKRAVEEGDSIYLENLYIALRCTVSLQQVIAPRELLVDCQNIATGDKNYFFSFIRKVQKSFPHLHRRAILAPWLMTNNVRLRTHAIEYYFSATQKKPKPHPADCKCKTLLYRMEEIKYALNTPERRASVKTEKYQRGRLGELHTVNDLCSILMNSKDIKWETHDTLPFPSNANRLLTATEAASSLRTTKSTIHHLRLHGLLRGERFNRRVGILIPASEIEDFRSQYVLNREVAANLGMRPRTVHHLLTKAGARKAHHAAFSSLLIVYRRDSIPESFLKTLTAIKDRMQTSTPLTPRNGMTYTKAASKLSLDLKDIPTLINLEILKTTQTVRKSGLPGRELCTVDSVRLALRWRKRFFTFAEAHRYTGCSSKLLHMRFVASGFAKELRLNVTSLMTRSAAEKIKEHFSIYTTAITARSEYGLAPRTLNRLIAEGKIHPLPPSHNDYLHGQVTIPRHELDMRLRGVESL